MTSRPTSRQATPRPAGRPARRGPTGRQLWVPIAVAVVVVVVVGGLILAFGSDDAGGGRKSASADGQATRGYQVGDPGIGAPAPDFTLPSTAGGTVTLASFRRQSVLLYFHEGLGCQPCWDQIRDLQSAGPQLRAAGITQLVTITSGPVDLIAQKIRDDHLSAVALADTDLAVSRTYNANQFGMMGTDRDGHTFVLVGPDGRIQWRADYGGAPDFTMYVALDRLFADLKAGRSAS